MPRIRPGTSAQNYEAKVPHKHEPIPELPKRPKVFSKKPADMARGKRKRK